MIDLDLVLDLVLVLPASTGWRMTGTSTGTAVDGGHPPRDWAHFGHTLPSLTKNPEAFQLRDSL